MQNHIIGQFENDLFVKIVENEAFRKEQYKIKM